MKYLVKQPFTGPHKSAFSGPREYAIGDLVEAAELPKRMLDRLLENGSLDAEKPATKEK